MKPRLSPQLSTGAMSDIAFLLLIFFVTTTRILDEQGIPVVLPRMDAPAARVSETDILHIYINADDRIRTDGEIVGLVDLRDFLSERIADGMDQRIISLHCAREASYSVFIGVYDAIRGAYRRAWNELAYKTYNLDFAMLTDAQKRNIMKRCPLVISEAD